MENNFDKMKNRKNWRPFFSAEMMNRTYDFVMDGAMVNSKNDSETTCDPEDDTHTIRKSR